MYMWGAGYVCILNQEKNICNSLDVRQSIAYNWK